MLKQWKLVERAALHTLKQLDIVINEDEGVWNELNIEHSPLSNSRERWAHSDTLDPVPTAKLEYPLFYSWKYTFRLCLFSIELNIMAFLNMGSLTSSLLMKMSSYKWEDRLMQESFIRSYDYRRNQFKSSPSPDEFHSVCPRQITFPWCLLHRSNSFLEHTKLEIALDEVYSSLSQLMSMRWRFPFFISAIASSVSMCLFISRIANPKNMYFYLRMGKAVSLLNSPSISLQAQQTSLKPFSAMSTIYYWELWGYVSSKHIFNIFSGGPLMKIILLGFLSDAYCSFYQLPSSSFSSISDISSFTSSCLSSTYSTNTPSL